MAREDRPDRHRRALRAAARRRRADGLLAHALLGLMILSSLLLWGSIPVFGLWIASQVQFLTDNIGLELLAGFVALLGMLFGGLVVLKRIDQAWIPGHRPWPRGGRPVSRRAHPGARRARLRSARRG